MHLKQLSVSQIAALKFSCGQCSSSRDGKNLMLSTLNYDLLAQDLNYSDDCMLCLDPELCYRVLHAIS